MDPRLADLAGRLGVAVAYVDADDRPQQSSAAAVGAIVELLSGPGAAPTEAAASGAGPAFDDVVLVRGGVVRSGVPTPPSPEVVHVEVEHDDGGSQVVYEGPATGLAEAPRWREQPIGIHRLHWRVAGRSGESTLLVAPQRFPVPVRDGPGLTLFAPLYSLWTPAEPLPAYDSLAALGAAVRPLGVGTIATLPLYAPGMGEHFDSSPYSPVSRFHWNELFVPDRLLRTGAGTRGRDGGPGGGSEGSVGGDAGRVDWGRVLSRRTEQLVEYVATMDDGEQRALDRFVAARPDVVTYARLMAAGDPGRERVHLVGQWLAERAVGEATAALAAEGQLLALDLPVGTRGESWETWRWPELFMRGAQIGAPPDTFFRAGQNWGLPPLNPVASRRDGHRVWHDLLAFACRHAGVLRIDHVMQVHRLWWIPEGNAADDGAYVHYPADELLAVAAIVAHRTGTIVVGEDLGTVPPAVVRLLEDWGLIGMHEEGFVVHRWASDEPPTVLDPVPTGSWAGIRTHDMEPLALMSRTLDTGRYRVALGEELGHEVGADPLDLAASMAERLRRSDAFDVVLDVDDVVGVDVPHNVPGTIGPANWSRRLDVPVGDLTDDRRARRLLHETAITTADDNEGAR